MKEFLKKYKFVLIGLFCLIILFLYFYKIQIEETNFYKSFSGIYWEGFGSNTKYRLFTVDFFTFKILSSDYAKDKEHVYFGNSLLNEADEETFEFLEFQYAKDKNNVYYYGKIIQDADLVTFKILDPNSSKDKNSCYVCPIYSCQIAPMSECDEIENQEQ